MTERLLNAMLDPKRLIVVHHNHPSSRTLSEIDIAALAYPGIHSVWAHGHDGTTSRGALTASARKVLALRSPVDADKGLRQLARDMGAAIRPSILGALTCRTITADQAGRIHYHLVATVLSKADIVDYRDNFDLQHLTGKLDVHQQLLRAVSAARWLLFGDTKRRMTFDRRDKAPWHVAEVGTTFDRAELLARSSIGGAERKCEYHG